MSQEAVSQLGVRLAANPNDPLSQRSAVQSPRDGRPEIPSSPLLLLLATFGALPGVRGGSR